MRKEIKVSVSVSINSDRLDRKRTREAIPEQQRESSKRTENDSKGVDIQSNQDSREDVWSRPNWPSYLEKLFVDLLVEQMNYIDKSENSFDEDTWDHICEEFKKKTGANFDKTELKKHLGILRKRYFIVKPLCDHRGFGWNDLQKKAHPEIKRYGKYGCPIYEQLRMIFTKSRANVRCARTGRDIMLERGKVLHRKTPVLPAHPQAAPTPINPVALATSKFVQNNMPSLAGAGVDANFSGGRGRHQLVAPLTSCHKKRNIMRTDNVKMQSTLGMVSTPKLEGTASTKIGDQFSMTRCVRLVTEMQGVNQQLFHAAMDLFQNSVWRETFISIKSEKRLLWLQTMPPAAA